MLGTILSLLKLYLLPLPKAHASLTNGGSSPVPQAAKQVGPGSREQTQGCLLVVRGGPGAPFQRVEWDPPCQEMAGHIQPACYP